MIETPIQENPRIQKKEKKKPLTSKRKAFYVGAIILITSLTGALVTGYADPTTGKIISKNHEKEKITYKVVDYDRLGIQKPFTRKFDGEDWTITIQNGNRETKLYISEEEYNGLDIGERVKGTEPLKRDTNNSSKPVDNPDPGTPMENIGD